MNMKGCILNRKGPSVQRLPAPAKSCINGTHSDNLLIITELSKKPTFYTFLAGYVSDALRIMGLKSVYCWVLCLCFTSVWQKWRDFLRIDSLLSNWFAANKGRKLERIRINDRTGSNGDISTSRPPAQHPSINIHRTCQNLTQGFLPPTMRVSPIKGYQGLSHLVSNSNATRVPSTCRKVA